MDTWGSIDIFLTDFDLNLEAKLAINPSLEEVNPSKRSKKAEDRRIRLKQELGGILSTEECCFLGSKIKPTSKKVQNSELTSSYSTYSQELKEQISIPYIQGLEKRGKVGNTIIDWGSGFNPLSSHLAWTHSYITVDAVSGSDSFAWEQKIIFDMGKLAISESFNISVFEQKLQKILATETVESSVDFMIFSEILNYVNTKKILTYADKILKPWGSILIINELDRGLYRHFDRHRISNNETLLKVIKNLNFEIDELLIIDSTTISYGWFFAETTYMIMDPTNISRREFQRCMYAIVARKN